LKIKVGKWVLDYQEHKLISIDNEVQLKITTFKLMQLFISKQGEIVSIPDIKSFVWGSEYTTDNLVHQTIRTLRQSLQQEESGECYIKTIPRHGYRLVAPVSVMSEEACKSATSAHFPIKANKVKVYSKITGVRLITLGIGLLILFAASQLITFTKNGTVNQKEGIEVLLLRDKNVSEEQQNQLSNLETYLKKNIEPSEQKAIRLENFWDEIDNPSPGHKLIVSFNNEKRVVVSLLFGGTPSRLIYVNVKELENLDHDDFLSEIQSELSKGLRPPDLKRGSSGITHLLKTNGTIRSLFSHSSGSSEQLSIAVDLIKVDIESSKAEWRYTQRHFLMLLNHFYGVKSISSEQLGLSVNILLRDFGHNQYSMAVAALYLSDAGDTELALELLKHHEESAFVYFIKGQLELGEGRDKLALVNFRNAYVLEPDFEDNNFFYLSTLINNGEHKSVAQFLKNFDASVYETSEVTYKLFDWLITEEGIGEATNFLGRNLATLPCNAKLFGTLAYVNSALQNNIEAQLWLGEFNSLEHERGWLIPSIKYSAAISNKSFVEYSSWYNSLQSNTMEGNAYDEAVVFQFSNLLALNSFDNAKDLLPTLKEVTGAFDDDMFSQFSKVVLEAQLAEQGGVDIHPMLKEASQYVDKIITDELFFKDGMLASYYVLDDSFKLAEKQLILGCKKTPAMCIGWRNVPLLGSVTLTSAYKNAQIEAIATISETRQVLDSLNWETKFLCGKLNNT
jgi:DNA-binding winged helix-turn-helix (wHTH) protein/tetratricopeptide (TPR) repeat protein